MANESVRKAYKIESWCIPIIISSFLASVRCMGDSDRAFVEFGKILFVATFIFTLIFIFLIKPYLNALKDDSKKYNDLILKLLALVMNANGENLVCELDQVKDTIRRYYDNEREQKKALAQFKVYLEQFDNMDINVIANILKRSSNFDVQSIIMEAMAVAFADGEYSEPEVALLQRLSSKLGMTYDQYISTLHIFKARKRAGHYGNPRVSNDDNVFQTEAKFNEYATHDFNQYGLGYWQRDKYGKKTWVQSDYRFAKNSNKRKENKQSDEQRQSNSNSQSQSNSYNTRSYTHSALESEYMTLGITSSATDDQVRTAWKKLISKWHPDRYESMGAEAVRNATENSKIINEAYNNICKARGMS
ncbi:MAG: DnaJ domain-containing protein [Paludibacteraceae bacterium]|nr:DnaJ domain-containing protein [Paludibacteraceae bacterium]